MQFQFSFFAMWQYYHMCHCLLHLNVKCSTRKHAQSVSFTASGNQLSVVCSLFSLKMHASAGEDHW